MKNITNAIYDVLMAEKALDKSNSFLAEALIIADFYTEVAKTGATVRLKGVIGGELMTDGLGGVRRDNVVFDMAIYVVPPAQTEDDRNDSRFDVDRFADEIATVLVDSISLRQDCINVDSIQYFEDWTKPGSVKTPAIGFRVFINTR